MNKTKYILLFFLSNAFFIGILTSLVPTTNHIAEKVNEGTQLSTPTSSADKDWTFMVYLDADCNLEDAGIDDINEMEQVGSDSNINIIVQIDRIPGYDSSNGDWKGAKRYYISRDYSGSTISSTVVQDLGEVNMGSSATLQNFVQWGKSNYPADNYALILWDHGSGVMWGNYPGGVCWDDTNYNDYLTLSEIKSVLSSNPVDLLGFDACLMGAIEAHYQLKDIVDVVVGSEELEPGDGYPYNDILNWLKANPSATAQQLGQQIVIKYDNSYSDGYDTTQAAANAIDSQFITSLNYFISELDSIAVSQKANIQTARTNSQSFDEPAYIDLYDLADNIQTQCSGNIDDAAQYLKGNISRIVIEERHKSAYPEAHGLSIYFPSSQSSYSSNYESNDFANNLAWDEFLMKYYTGTGGSNYDDEYEENDAFSSATILTQGTYYGLILNATDLDYYNISVTTGTVITVDILFTHSEGDLDLTLYDTTQSFANNSDSTTDNEHLTYNATTTGYYSIEVDSYSNDPYQSYILQIAIDIDDGYEENDDWSDPALIPVNTTITNLVCIDSDHYYFYAKENDLINITIWYSYPDGDLDLYYWNFNYIEILDASYTASDTENILAIANYTGSSEYQFEVYNYEDNINYSMRVETGPADDSYEENDYAGEEPLLGYGTYLDLACLDYDFYNVSLTQGTWINITIYFDNEEGNLELYLLDEQWDTVAMSMSFSDNEFIFYYVEVSAVYTIWVYYDDNINLNYNLTIFETTEVWDDDFEQNDWFDEATLLEMGLFENLSAIDWDTYMIYAKDNYEITITLEYNHSKGNLDLYLIYYDILDPGIAWILDVSSSGTNKEQLIFETWEDGYYYFLVYLDDINMGYDLTLSKKEIKEEDDDDTEKPTAMISGFPLLIFTCIMGFTILVLVKSKSQHSKKY